MGEQVKDRQEMPRFCPPPHESVVPDPGRGCGFGESSLWEAKDDAKIVLADVVGSTVLLKGKLRKEVHKN